MSHYRKVRQIKFSTLLCFAGIGMLVHTTTLKLAEAEVTERSICVTIPTEWATCSKFGSTGKCKSMLERDQCSDSVPCARCNTVGSLPSRHCFQDEAAVCTVIQTVECTEAPIAAGNCYFIPADGEFPANCLCDAEEIVGEDVCGADICQ